MIVNDSEYKVVQQQVLEVHREMELVLKMTAMTAKDWSSSFAVRLKHQRDEVDHLLGELMEYNRAKGA
jgi:hypothetical protein